MIENKDILLANVKNYLGKIIDSEKYDSLKMQIERIEQNQFYDDKMSNCDQIDLLNDIHC